MTDNKEQISRNRALFELWRRANLQWKLDSTQKEIYKFIKENPNKITVLSVSRRLGKSYLLLCIAIEECLKRANSIVLYITPEQKQTKTIIRPLMQQILEDCPPKLRPEYKSNESLYRFANGSEIRMVGTDNEQYESQRGIDCHLHIIDECGFVNAPLHYIIQSVLIPTTLHTKGKIILSSTPPKRLDHPFVSYMKDAQATNAFIKKTIYQCPRVTEEDIEDIAKSLPGGKNGSTFRREFLCILETDEDINVIPEFTDDLEVRVVKEWEKPPHYDVYVGMDLGYRDATGIVFAYLDFTEQKLVIEDEWLCAGREVTMTKIKNAVDSKETFHFTDPLGQRIKPYQRVSDVDLLVINDLAVQHGVHFTPAKKYDKPSLIAQFRVALAEERVIINPRCKNTILHIKHAVWNKNKTSYERSEAMYHYDLLDAVLYMFRSVDWKKNPYPAGYSMPKGPNVHFNPFFKENKPYDFILEMFKPRSKGISKRNKNNK